MADEIRRLGMRTTRTPSIENFGRADLRPRHAAASFASRLSSAASLLLWSTLDVPMKSPVGATVAKQVRGEPFCSVRRASAIKESFKSDSWICRMIILSGWNEAALLKIVFAETESGAGQSPVAAIRRSARVAASSVVDSGGFMPSPTEQQIRIRAHRLWEIAGRPEGRDDEFWHEAERELRDGSANNPDEKSKTFLE